MPRSTTLLLALSLVVSCSEEPEPAAPGPSEPPVLEVGWPEWPEDEEAARALIEARSRHAGEEEAPLGAGAIVDAVDRAAARGELVAGWRPIADALRARDTVIFGVFHDGEGQHAAFRRLFGPTGTADDRILALELFDARGAWDGIDEDAQRGDDAALARYLEHGHSLAELRGSLARGAYTAWKYALIDEVLALVVAARAGGQPVVGCDAPPQLVARLARWSEDTRLRMRELHCALAVERARREADGAPVALLFGDAHAAPDGLPRFLPGATTVVRVVGGRRSEAGVEPALSERLAVTAPLLAPLDEHRHVLVLPDARLRADLDRSRVRAAAPGDEGVTWTTPGAGEPSTVLVGGRATEVGEDGGEVATPLEPGPHAFVVRAGARRLAGGFVLGRGDRVEAFVDPSSRRVDLRYHSTRAEPPGSAP